MTENTVHAVAVELQMSINYKCKSWNKPYITYLSELYAITHAINAISSKTAD